MYSSFVRDSILEIILSQQRDLDNRSIKALCIKNRLVRKKSISEHLSFYYIIHKMETDRLSDLMSKHVN